MNSPAAFRTSIDRDSGRFELRTAMTVAVSDFEAWCRDARAGARIVYAWGRSEPRATATWLLAKEMCGAGFVRLFAKRGGGETQWIAERVGSKDAAARVPAKPSADEIDEAVLRICRRCARFGTDLPSNAAIADAAELRTPQDAMYRLRKLQRLGKIRVVDHGPGRARGIEVLA